MPVNYRDVFSVNTAAVHVPAAAATPLQLDNYA